jgi:DNA repair protein RAD50
LFKILKTRDENGDVVSINHTCTEMERQVPELLGVSRAVLENVIFCHQEESLWAFGETSTLKGIFDELFDTTMWKKFLNYHF